MHERAGWITQHARQDKWDSQRSPLARLPCSNSRWRWMREPSLSSNILGVVLLWHGASDHTAAAKMAGIRASVQPTRLVVFNPNSNKDPGPLLMPCTSPAGPLPALRPPPLSRRSRAPTPRCRVIFCHGVLGHVLSSTLPFPHAPLGELG